MNQNPGILGTSTLKSMVQLESFFTQSYGVIQQ